MSAHDRQCPTHDDKDDQDDTMSDDYFAQQQAIAATGAANQARQDAFNAQRQADQAGSDARMARDAAAAAERRSRQLSQEVGALRQANAALGERLQHMASMQEAMAGIPFLRQEIAQRFERPAAVRALACRWVEGSAPPAQLRAALDATGDAGDDWLSCALRQALARDLGDDDQAAYWHARTLERDALHGYAWRALNALREGVPVDLDELLSLLDALEGVAVVGHPFHELAALAGDGRFGRAARAGAVALAHRWCRQLLDAPDAQQHISDFATAACVYVDKPVLKVDLAQTGSQPAQMYAKFVLVTWRVLEAIAQGLAQAPMAFSPSAPATLLLDLVRAVPDEEAEMRAKLAMYEAVVRDGEASERATRVRAETHAALVGRRLGVVDVLAAFLRTSLKHPVLAVLGPAIERYVDPLAQRTELAAKPLEPGLASDAAIPGHLAERWRKQAWDAMGYERQRELKDAAARALTTQRAQARRKAFTKAALWTGGVTLVASMLSMSLHALLAMPIPDIVFRLLPLGVVFAIPLLYGALAGWIALALAGRRFDRVERAPFRWEAPLPDEVSRQADDVVAARTRLAELAAEIPRQAARIKATLAQAAAPGAA